MTQTFLADAKRDDGTAITVEWSLGSSGEPHYDSPGHICDGGGSGPEINIIKAFTETGDVTLTDAECERIEAEIAEGFDPADYYSEEDYR